MLDGSIYVVLIAMGLVTLLPFVNVFSKSISEEGPYLGQGRNFSGRFSARHDEIRGHEQPVSKLAMDIGADYGHRYPRVAAYYGVDRLPAVQTRASRHGHHHHFVHLHDDV